MKIRFAREEDKKVVKELWSYSFQDSQSYVDYYFSNRYEASNNIILEDNQTVVASLLINPYTLVLNGEEKKVRYIVGVSVFSEHRGKGYSSFLMKQTLSLLQECKDEMVLLMPIDTSIYRRYGFINTFFDHSFKMELGKVLPNKTNIRFEKVDKRNAEHIELLLELYHEEMKKKTAYIKRTKEDFVVRISEWEVEGGDMYLMYQGDNVVGYFMIHPRYEKDTALVQELIAANQNAVFAVINFLNHHQTQCKSAVIHSVNKNLFDLSIAYDNQISRNSHPFMMSRVLDAKAVLQQEYDEIFSELEGKKILVEDTILSQNNGVFQFLNGVVTKVDSLKWDMKMTIDALSLLYMRQIDLEMLLKSDMLEVTEEMKILLKQCNQKIRLGESYSNDYV